MAQYQSYNYIIHKADTINLEPSLDSRETMSQNINRQINSKERERKGKREGGEREGGGREEGRKGNPKKGREGKGNNIGPIFKSLYKLTH